MITKTEDRKTIDRGSAQRDNSYSLAPLVNIMEDKEGYVLEAEMPGVNKEGLELSLEGNELTLVGHKQQDGLKAEPLYRESTSSDYRRVFVLDPTIDTQKISAHIEQGLLKLTLPKAERVKPRKIQVAE
jgi:HSP20 family protein